MVVLVVGVGVAVGRGIMNSCLIYWYQDVENSTVLGAHQASLALRRYLSVCFEMLC